MDTMKVLIIEDETAAAQNLQSILHEVAPSIRVIQVLESIEESAEYLQNNPQPDLVFMDIHLADGVSFRILDRVEITAPVIFTTAYDQYALDAFRLCSIDYLLKPLSAESVRRALEKLERMTGTERAAYTPRIKQAVKEYDETFLIHQRDKIIPLHRDQIAFCYTANERVAAYDFQGESYPIDRTLEALQSQLPATDFFRANRQFIISRRAVHEITVWFGSRLSLSLTVPIPERIIISKARVPEFKAWLRSVRAAE